MKFKPPCKAIRIETGDIVNARNIASIALSHFMNGQVDLAKEIGVDIPWDRDYVALKIYETNKDLIENAIIKAQQAKIESLEATIKSFYERH